MPTIFPPPTPTSGPANPTPIASPDASAAAFAPAAAASAAKSTPPPQFVGHPYAQPFPDKYSTLTTDMMLGIMGISLVLSLLAFLWSISHYFRLRTPFNFAVVLLAVFFMGNDLSYWSFVALWKDDVVMPYVWEVIRGSTSLLAATHITGLSLYRFAIFSETAFASWYTRTIRNILLVLNYLLAMAIGGFLIYTYLDPFVPHHDTRRLPGLGIILVWTVLIDVGVMILTFICVLRIQRQIGLTLAELRAKIARVMGSIVVMTLSGGIGIFAYAWDAQSSTYRGGSIGGIMARIYLLCAMVVWDLIVSIVRGSANPKLPSNIDQRYGSGSAGLGSGGGRGSQHGRAYHSGTGSGAYTTNSSSGGTYAHSYSTTSQQGGGYQSYPLSEKPTLESVSTASNRV
ncbi:hypothetical protein BCR44DRAFT_35989 [Catenaria anguillulae PL171]|uniref:Uncharacterized protein n=1 Tax=Catenaria anguillulae PL171 TaxID=765915 RepID=A0A1Y2HF24_9FUNG|nr:hypothetical protein BCR44DRAFT_35989 [Catenaria anguillulae PL171]